MAHQFLKRTHTATLTSRTSLICFPNKLSSEINFIKKLASWNGVPRPAVKCIIHLVLDTTNKSNDNANHLRYWPFTFVSLTIAIVEKVQSNCVKTQYDVNKLSFVAPEIKQLLCLIRLFFIFLVLIVVPITLAKQKRFYQRSVEHAWTDNNRAVYKHLNYCTGSMQHLFVWYCIFEFVTVLRHHPLFKTVTNLI